jgi:hypothetical protein
MQHNWRSTYKLNVGAWKSEVPSGGVLKLLGQSELC